MIFATPTRGFLETEKMLYELMVVINPKIDTEATAKKIEKFIADSEAESIKAQKLGRKDLAYLIKKQKEADYFLYHFDASGDAIKVIGDKIRLEQEAVLRYLFIKAPKAFKVSRLSQDAEEGKTKVTVKTVTPVKTTPKAKKPQTKKKEAKTIKQETKVTGKRNK